MHSCEHRQNSQRGLGYYRNRCKDKSWCWKRKHKGTITTRACDIPVKNGNFPDSSVVAGAKMLQESESQRKKMKVRRSSERSQEAVMRQECKKTRDKFWFWLLRDTWRKARLYWITAVLPFARLSQLKSSKAWIEASWISFSWLLKMSHVPTRKRPGFTLSCRQWYKIGWQIY